MEKNLTAKEIVEQIEKKIQNKEELTVLEKCIIDMKKEMNKTGKEITMEEIDKMRFWMD